MTCIQDNNVLYICIILLVYDIYGEVFFVNVYNIDTVCHTAITLRLDLPLNMLNVDN